ncbi:MAG TPA: hypothetical protein VIX84_01245 [Acidimicrobiales bacterium]
MANHVRLLQERTGEGRLDAWNRRGAESGASDETSLARWLEAQGVTGYPRQLWLHIDGERPAGRLTDALPREADVLNLKVALGSVDDVDDVVRDALERAFRANI